MNLDLNNLVGKTAGTEKQKEREATIPLHTDSTSKTIEGKNWYYILARA
jgi:hypothetical protein